MSLTAFGQVLIIVDDTDIAVELLEKRSAIYSSRPQSHMAELYVGRLWKSCHSVLTNKQRRVGLELRILPLWSSLAPL